MVVKAIDILLWHSAINFYDTEQNIGLQGIRYISILRSHAGTYNILLRSYQVDVICLRLVKMTS